MRRSCDVGVAGMTRAAKLPSRRGVALPMLILLVGVGAGCGPSPGANRAAANLPIPPMNAAPPPVVVEKPEPPPPAPKDLELSARITEPTRFFREVVAHLPAGIGANIPNAEQVLELGLGSKLADTVDLTAPVDVASVSAGSSAIFVSFGVKADVEGRIADRVPVEERRGLLFVKKDDNGGGGGGMMTRSGTCAFVPPQHAAALRLVCASEHGSFEETARWLAHRSGVESVDSDVRVTIPGRAIREGKNGRSQPLVDQASKLGTKVVEDFVAEIAAIQLDVRLGATTTDLTGTLRLTQRRSMLANALVTKTTASPPSPAFFRLPVDSLFALHTTGADAVDLSPLRRTIYGLLEQSLVEDGYLPEKVGAIRTHLESVLLTGGPLVVGAGIAGGLDRAERALAALDAASGTNGVAAAEASARAALVPWVMFEVEQNPAVVVLSMKGIVKGADEADKTRKPGSATASQAKKDPDGDHVDVRATALDPALKLPVGTLALEVVVAPRTKGKHPVRRGKLFVVPKGNATWIGYSEDAQAIATRLRTAIDDTTEAGTLARSKDATDLKSKSGVLTAMTSMSGLAMLAADRGTRDDLLADARVSARLTALPSKGSNVFTVVGTTEIASPASGPASLVLTARAPRGVLTDVATILLH